MSYVSLYRAYRPSNFNEVSGQQHVVKTLKNAIINDKVAHAYLFSGPRGTGKTSIAKILAKAINCLDPQDGNPCDKCSICQSINQNKASDIIEMDAASNSGVDDIRDLKEKVRFLPAETKYKVYIIDEAHALSMKAYNALLKTLEEPPGYVIFVLATTEPYSIPATILSRTQIFDFKGLDISQIEDRIKFICEEEKIKITPDAIHAISLLADGGMRDALSLLDQCISYSNSNVTISEVNRISGSLSNELLMDLAESIIEADPSRSLQTIDNILKEGKELQRILSDLTVFFKDLMLKKNNFPSVNQLFKNERFINLAKEVGNDKLYYYIESLTNTSSSIKKTTQKRAFLEMSIVKMSDYNENLQFNLVNEVNILKKRLEQLEQGGGVTQTKKPVLATKLETKEKTNEDFITVKDIADVLNNSDKELRVNLQNQWNEIANKTPSELLRDCLLETTVLATSSNTALLSHAKLMMCDKLMQIESKEPILNICKSLGLQVTDYLVITTKHWDVIKKDYASKFKNVKIVELEDLEINIKKYKSKLSVNESNIVKKAKELFPGKKIEIED